MGYTAGNRRDARMEQSEDFAYEQRFARFSGRVEKMLMAIIVGGFILLFLSQFLLSFDSFRHLFAVTVRLEGVASQ